MGGAPRIHHLVAKQIAQLIRAALEPRRPWPTRFDEGVPAVAVRTILVPTDFSEGSAGALSWARTFAHAFHAEIVLLHVVDLAYTWPSVSGPVALPTPAPAEVADRIAELARESLASLAKDAQEVAHRLVRTGHARETIIDVAREVKADLIVMGTHGHRGFSELFMGSVAEYVVRHAPMPVVTVRAPA